MTIFEKALISASHDSGIEWLRQGDYERAEADFRKALALSVKIGDLFEQGKSLRNLGEALNSLGHSANAERCIRRAIQIEVERGDLEKQAKGYWHMENLKRDGGDLEGAKKERQRAIDTYLEKIRLRAEDEGKIRSVHQVVRDAIMHDDPTEAEQVLSAKIQDSNATQHHKTLAKKLQAILRGERDPGVVEDPALPYFEVAELRLLLEYLAEHEEKRGIYKLQFKSFIRSHLGALVAGKQLSFNFEEMDSWLNSTIVKPLLRAFTDEQAKFLTGVPVSMLCTAEPNAKTLFLEGTGSKPAVLVDFFLISYIRDMLVIELSAMGPSAMRDFRKFLNRLNETGQFYSNPQAASCPDRLRSLKPSSQSENIVESILEGVIGFIICHEYGHILAGHLEKGSRKVSEPDNFESYKKKEFEADSIGVDLALPWLLTRERETLGRSYLRLPVASPLLTLSFIAFLQSCRSHAGSHVDAHERRARIGPVLEPKLSDGALKLVKGLEETLGLAISQGEGVQ